MAAIRLSDLPQKYQEQAVKKYIQQRARKQAAGPPALPCRDQNEKQQKYHNRPTERMTASGSILKFDSMKEARRYDALLLRLQAGEIRDLKMQADFTLQEAYTDAEGKRVRAIRYRADFVYQERYEVLTKVRQPDGSNALDARPAWREVVEDVKSRATATAQYRIKKKLFKEKYGFDIKEV